jgi:hypothetical protein
MGEKLMPVFTFAHDLIRKSVPIPVQSGDRLFGIMRRGLPRNMAQTRDKEKANVPEPLKG